MLPEARDFSIQSRPSPLPPGPELGGILRSTFAMKPSSRFARNIIANCEFPLDVV